MRQRRAALKPVLSRDSILCTDSGKALVAAARERGVTPHKINLGGGYPGDFQGLSRAKRQRLRQPTQDVAATIPWRGYALLAPLSWRVPTD